MLPGDTKQCREATTDTGHGTQQSMLGNHFPHSEEVILYSDRVFEATAIKWLIQTNQVIYLCSLVFLLVYWSLTFSQFTHLTTKAAKKWWISHPEQHVVSPYPHPSWLVHILFTCSNKRCIYSRSILMSVFALLPFSRTNVHLIGPHCWQASQPDMRCMAGQ